MKIHINKKDTKEQYFEKAVFIEKKYFNKK